jgi:hypothetical protein
MTRIFGLRPRSRAARANAQPSIRGMRISSRTSRGHAQIEHVQRLEPILCRVAPSCRRPRVHRTRRAESQACRPPPAWDNRWLSCAFGSDRGCR